jgi:hypothetical protein
MVVVLLIVAVILAAVEAVRARSLGWAAVAFLALALAWPHLAALS